MKKKTEVDGVFVGRVKRDSDGVVAIELLNSLPYKTPELAKNQIKFLIRKGQVPSENPFILLAPVEIIDVNVELVGWDPAYQDEIPTEDYILMAVHEHKTSTGRFPHSVLLGKQTYSRVCQECAMEEVVEIQMGFGRVAIFVDPQADERITPLGSNTETSAPKEKEEKPQGS